ncbi:hypothetical protein D3C77_442860 [compost metagenome]
MPDRHLQGDGTAIAETEQIGLINMQVSQQCCSVVGRLLETERSLGDVGGVAVALLLESNDLTLGRQRGKNLRKRRLDGVATTMQQHKRRLSSVSDAVSFEIEVQPIDGGVTGLIHRSILRKACGHNCLVAAEWSFRQAVALSKVLPEKLHSHPHLGGTGQR